MQSPPAGKHVSGLHSMRLIPSGSDAANVVRCDGSLNLYRCKGATSRIYEPIDSDNFLQQNVDGSSNPTGWTEITRPNEFRYEYNSTGQLKYVANPAGQRWTMVRSGSRADHGIWRLAGGIRNAGSSRRNR